MEAEVVRFCTKIEHRNSICKFTVKFKADMINFVDMLKFVVTMVEEMVRICTTERSGNHEIRKPELEVVRFWS